MAQRLDPFLRSLRQKIGQHLQVLQRLALKHLQIQQEGGVLQFVRRVVGASQQRQEQLEIRTATDGFTRLG